MLLSLLDTRFPQRSNRSAHKALRYLCQLTHLPTPTRPSMRVNDYEKTLSTHVFELEKWAECCETIVAKHHKLNLYIIQIEVQVGVCPRPYEYRPVQSTRVLLAVVSFNIRRLGIPQYPLCMRPSCLLQWRWRQVRMVWKRITFPVSVPARQRVTPSVHVTLHHVSIYQKAAG